jgi:hypothetical protein
LDELASLDPYVFVTKHWTSSQYAFQKLIQLNLQTHMQECPSQTSNKS